MTAPARSDRDPNALEEELVAYLDDELDDAARERLERRLADDPKVRESLRKLTRVWDALETLPRAEVNEAFATTTVEAVVAKETLSQATSLDMGRSRRRWLRGAALLAVCSAMGFLGAWLLWPDPNRQLANDLPILERMEEYRVVPSIAFLDELHAAKLFAGNGGESPAAAPFPSSDSDQELVAANLARLASMEVNERSVIAKSRIDLEGLSDAEQARIRQLEIDLRSHPDQAELRGVMTRYAQWFLTTLSDGQRSELRGLSDPSARVTRIREMIAADLPEPDRRVVMDWIRRYAEEEADELLKIAQANQLIPRPQLLEAIRRDQKKWQATLVVFRAAETEHFDELPFNELDFRILESRLSPEPAKRLEECPNLDLKKLVLGSWLKTMTRDFGRKMRKFDPRLGQEEYAKLLDEMDPAEKYEIFSLPPDDARRALSDTWYFRNGDKPFGPGGIMPPPPDGRFGPPDGDRDGRRRGGRRDRDEDGRD